MDEKSIVVLFLTMILIH